jgi:hypothetical protein
MDSANWMKKTKRFHDTASITMPPEDRNGQPIAFSSNTPLISKPKPI